jgi:hypothetical protein
VGIIAVAANLASFGLLLGVEALVSHLGWIPARNPQEGFLYLMDRNLFRIGDVIGLTVVAFAIGNILSRAGFPTKRYIISAIVFAAVLTGTMHWLWLWQPIQDSAYPFSGQTSLLGYVHLPYFAGHIIWVCLGIRKISREVLGFTLLGLLGGVIWVVTLMTA